MSFFTYNSKQSSSSLPESNKPITTNVDIDNKINKMMTPAENKSADDPTTVKAVSLNMNDYFFPGGGAWQPITVRASTLADAEAIHREKRQPRETPEKVEAQETNNE
jgi:hypothetical protein